MIDSISVVIAAYNERESLPACLERTVRFLKDHARTWELIVVDDGSTDGTGAWVDAWVRRTPEGKAIHLEQNSGMGAALLAGYGAATREWVTMLPGDGQIDAYELLKLFALAEGADLVTSLYENRLETPFRRVVSLGLRILTAMIVGSRAGTEGTYLVRRDVLGKLGASSRSFLLNLEIPIRARSAGYRVRTARIRVQPRTGGVSKAATLGRILHTFRELFRLRLRLRRERRPS